MSDERATVRTRIVTQRDTDIPVDDRLMRQGGRWLVYDVRIEGVSLVENYREQFNDVIVSSSYGNLVKKMEARVHDGTDAGVAPKRNSNEVKHGQSQ